MHYADELGRAGLGSKQRLRYLTQFIDLGFPDKEQEDWRYTDLSALNTRTYEVARTGLGAPAFKGFEGCAVQTFCNGSEKSADAQPLDDTALAQLNAAFAQKGLSLNLAAGERLAEPVHAITWNQSHKPVMVHLRHHIKLGERAEATVILQHGGTGEYLTTQHTGIELGAGSRLTVYRLQAEGADSHHLSQMDARLGRDSHLHVVNIDLGQGLARLDLNVLLAEAGSEVHLHGLYAPSGKAHVDNHTRIIHGAPHCISREFFRGIVGESAKAVFNGKIIVQPAGQKTDSEQRVANLLLSPKAEVNAKPELEIYADDVKCAHGATFGQLDEDAVFYLRSRGLSHAAARSLLTFTFGHEILNQIEWPTVKRWVQEEFLRRLPDGERLQELL